MFYDFPLPSVIVAIRVVRENIRVSRTNDIVVFYANVTFVAIVVDGVCVCVDVHR